MIVYLVLVAIALNSNNSLTLLRLVNTSFQVISSLINISAAVLPHPEMPSDGWIFFQWVSDDVTRI